MKCLQCGTELDRLTKWRGPSEYCSDECKKASQDEFNRLAMGRLMQPRPARTSARVMVGNVESGNGTLTVVTYPVGASSPLLTEPPEAEFIMEAAATLTGLQLRYQPREIPSPSRPLIPSSALPMGAALLALEAMLSGIRPRPRPARRLNGAEGKGGFARMQAAPPDFELRVCEPVWVASLGLTFNVVGIDQWSTAVSLAPVAGAPADTFTGDEIASPSPVSHRSIPSRRAARAIPAPIAFALGTERLIEAAVVSHPRLRIHLPMPVLNPFRPRYAFAPAPADETLPPEPVTLETEVVIVVDAGHQQSGVKSPVEAPAPASAVETAKPEARPLQTFAIPSFAGISDPGRDGFFSRMPAWQKGVAAVAVVVLAVGAWAVPAVRGHNARTVKLPSPAAPAPSYIGAGSWETGFSADTAGIARRRVISHYKPARAKRDYIFEFTGQIEERALGWVFRMKDARNYYCLKLEQPGDGATATVRLVKFAVVNGEEQPKGSVEFREPAQAGLPVTIRLDVRGQIFSTQVNGKQVDVWIDNQLDSGSVGFSNESGERAVIRTVKISY